MHLLVGCKVKVKTVQITGFESLLSLNVCHYHAMIRYVVLCCTMILRAMIYDIGYDIIHEDMI